MADELTQSENLKQLRALFAEHEDPRDAMRVFTGASLNAMARRVGMRRTDLNMMLAPGTTRRYLPERRQLEVEYHLPPYCLDQLLGDAQEKFSNRHTTTTEGGKSATSEAS